VRHVDTVERPLCELTASVGWIGDVTRAAYSHVDCPECLRQTIAESEERTSVLRELLSKVKVAS